MCMCMQIFVPKTLFMFVGAMEFDKVESILDTLLIPELKKLENFSENVAQLDKEDLHR